MAASNFICALCNKRYNYQKSYLTHCKSHIRPHCLQAPMQQFLMPSTSMLHQNVHQQQPALMKQFQVPKHISQHQPELNQKYYLIKSAFKNNIATYAIPNRKTSIAFEEFVNANEDVIKRRVESSLNTHNLIKFNITLVGEYIKIADEGLDLCDISHKTKMVLFSFGDEIDDVLKNQFEEIKSKMSEFQERDSGWTLSNIIRLEIAINKCSLVRGSSWISTPYKLAKKAACINVKNNDIYCFKWALIAALDNTVIYNRNLCESYTIEDISANIIYLQNGVEINFSFLKFPLPLKQIKQFEDNNADISVNVFGYNEDSNEIVGPYYVTKMEKCKHINLLLLENGERHHYILITDISRLVNNYM